MIVVVAGVSGSGKSTICGLLAGRLGWPFMDGDSLHPQANIAKMASGVPLTDEDRMPWLAAIGEWMDGQISAGQPGIVACSALKRAYRQMLAGNRPEVVIVLLLVDREVAARRLAARHGHFFDGRLLDSQFADLDPPVPLEPSVLAVETTDRPEQTAAEVLRRLGLSGAPTATGAPGV